LWKIVERFCGPSCGSAAGKNCGIIVERFCARTILPQFFPAALPVEGPQNHSTIFPQFFLGLEEFGASGLAWGIIVEGIIVEELWKHLMNAAESDSDESLT
jgi:hypothetical protein